MKTVSTERILAARLQELGIDPKGLPPHVMEHLRSMVDAEATRLADALAEKIAALEAKNDEQLHGKIARLITMQAVGKAFALPTAKPPGGAAK